ncbi:MAG: response regulator [Kaiparowitsia implicata GSE-PSE-MK54-09C]|jgi:PAS domain S-box-containing protein|nr:response regulator [Kaiparowitsia implicata GSE-PSE-MK54-09C]
MSGTDSPHSLPTQPEAFPLNSAPPQLQRLIEAEVERRSEARLAELETENAALKLELVHRERALREWQQTEATLQENQRFIQQILETTPNLLFLYDLQQQRIVFLNRQVQDMLGYSAYVIREMDNESLRRLVHAEDLATLDKNLQHVLSLTDGEACEASYRLRHASGEWRWLRTRYTIFDRSEAGQPHCILGTTTDITTYKQAEADLELARLKAERENHAKSHFLATMSHEIRTPMNAVLGMAEVLQTTELSPQQRDFVETICASGDTLLSIINDVLDFSKIDAGRLELAQVPFSVRQCVEKALGLLAPKAAEKDLDLAYLIELNVPDGLIGDPMRVQQILINLLSNAIKFTATGRVLLKVSARLLTSTLAAEPASAPLPTYTIRFSVQDTGVGIPSDRLDRLFQPFCQVDASVSRTYGGTGLGLVISQRLSELMGGRIWVESEPHAGSTFHVCIVAQAIVADGAAAPPLRVSGAASLAPVELAGKRLLLLDDNWVRRTNLMQQAQSWGMVVCAVTSRHEVETWVQCSPPFDAVVVNDKIEGESGLDVVDQLRQIDKAQRLPLILLVPRKSHKLYDAAPPSNTQFLPKPVRLAQFQQALVDALLKSPYPEASTPVPPIKQPSTQPLHILIAEDNKVNQKVLQRLLERLGYTADLAENGTAVLTALQHRSYDVILMDVQMPEMDGITATRTIQQTFPPEQWPYIIAVTANAMQGDQDECLKAGMDAYISKPIRLELLSQMLSRCTPRCTALKDGASGLSLEDCAIAPKSQSVGDLESPPLYAQTDSNPAPLDASVFEQFREDLGSSANRVLQEMIQCYLKEAPELVQCIQIAAQKQDTQALCRATHTLKSSSAVVGALPLAALCEYIEQSLMAADTATNFQVVTPLVAEYKRVAIALQATLATLHAQS